jgi:hypothetical protein
MERNIRDIGESVPGQPAPFLFGGGPGAGVTVEKRERFLTCRKFNWTVHA